VIAVSHEVRRQVDTLYHSPDWKTAVIYHGIDLAPFDAPHADPGSLKAALEIPPLTPVILFVGQLAFRKGPDLLLQAIPEILQGKPDARVLFVGEGENRAHLEREVDRFGIRQAVRFLGWRRGQALIDLYHACDVVCAPSRVEPFGIVPLSAWAASKPVVALRVGSVGEFIMDETTGLLVEPTPAAVARGVLGLFADFDRLRWIGRNGRVAAETAFRWDTIAEQTLAAYARRAAVDAERSAP